MRIQEAALLDPDYISKRKYSFTKIDFSQILPMSRVEDSLVYHRLFDRLFQLYPKVVILAIWKSQLSPLFFEAIRKNECHIKSLHLQNCQLGDQAAPLLSLIPLDNLSYLLLASDHFGNRGFKQLMKLSFPQLDIL